MYNLENGKLMNLHGNIFQEDDVQVAEITKFCIDKRHRKAYVANNFGEIIVINCQSGVKIKSVISHRIEEVSESQSSDCSSNNQSIRGLLND